MNHSEASEKMAALLDNAVPDEGGWTSRQVAEQVAEILEPDLYTAWCSENKLAILTWQIQMRQKAVRQTSWKQQERGRFAAWAKSAEPGTGPDPTGTLYNPFEIHYEVSPDHQRKALGMMTVEDLNFAADRYDDRAKANAFEAAFLRSLAKRVGDKTVYEVFTADELLSMRRGPERRSA